MEAPRELLETCRQAARAGGAQLLAWQGRFATREKAARDLVTDADLASQEAVLRVIGERHPQHAVLAEEEPAGGQIADGYCWVVDPLDGTTNYVHGFPCYCVSVAVALRGELLAATLYDPLADECFEAARGEGTLLNGNRVHVSQARELEQALVAVSLPPHLQEDSPDLASFCRVAPVCQAVRRTGSAALDLAYVAAGRLDAHWAHQIHPWDAAGGVLLVREAGGIVTGSRGDRFELAAAHYFAASTPELHAALLPLIAGPERRDG